MSLVPSDFGSDVNVLGQRLGEGGSTPTNPPRFVNGGALLIGATTDRLLTATGDILIHMDPLP